MRVPAFRENAGDLPFIELTEKLEDENLIIEDGVLSYCENIL